MTQRAFHGHIPENTISRDSSGKPSVISAARIINNLTPIAVLATELIIPASPGRATVILQNDGATSVYWGATGLTTSTGIELKAGTQIAINALSQVEIYLIAAGSGNTVRGVELG